MVVGRRGDRGVTVLSAVVEGSADDTDIATTLYHQTWEDRVLVQMNKQMFVIRTSVMTHILILLVLQVCTTCLT